MGTWIVNANPLGNVFLSALAAALPIAVLFWALAVRRMKGHYTAILAASLGVVVAIVVFRMPVGLAVRATGYGMIYGVWPVAWIVVTAVFLYNLSVKPGSSRSSRTPWPPSPTMAPAGAPHRLLLRGIPRRGGRLRRAGGDHRRHAGWPRLQPPLRGRESASSPTRRRSPSAPSASPSWSLARFPASTRWPFHRWWADACRSSRCGSRSTWWSSWPVGRGRGGVAGGAGLRRLVRRVPVPAPTSSSRTPPRHHRLHRLHRLPHRVPHGSGAQQAPGASRTRRPTTAGEAPIRRGPSRPRVDALHHPLALRRRLGHEVRSGRAGPSAIA